MGHANEIIHLLRGVRWVGTAALSARSHHTTGHCPNSPCSTEHIDVSQDHWVPLGNFWIDACPIECLPNESIVAEYWGGIITLVILWRCVPPAFPPDKPAVNAGATSCPGTPGL